MNDPTLLLRRYARERDEEAFAKLVADYFSLVHATASRRVGGDAEAAMDVAQVVFTELARKARSLEGIAHLRGWLHKHTCFVAGKHVRAEARRIVREQTSAHMHANDDKCDWPELAPVIDEAVQQLPEGDREAILLRFFEGRDLRSIGAAFGISDDAAQKRVQRALEKLKGHLQARGIVASSAALALLLSSNASSAVAGPVEGFAAKALAGVPNAAPSMSLAMKLAGAVVIALVAAVFLHRETQMTVSGKSLAQDAATPMAVAEAALQTNLRTQEVAPGIELRLRVLDGATENPLAGAMVRRTLPGLPWDAPTGDELTFFTDESGMARFLLPEATPERLSLYTTRAGYGGWYSSWTKSRNETIPDEFTVYLEPALVIGGRVLDAAGNPLANALVRMTKVNRGVGSKPQSSQRAHVQTATNRTDEAGIWIADHIPQEQLENISFSISHEDFARTNLFVAAAEIPALTQKTWTVTLSKGLNITGRVTDTNGAAITGAEILFSGPTDAYREETKTDSNGGYEFKNVSIAASYQDEEILTAMAPGFVGKTLAFDPRISPASLDFALEAGVTIRGRVVDANQMPIAGVRLMRDTGSTERRARASHAMVVTDSSGNFAWTSSPKSAQYFTIVHPGYEQLREFSLEPRDEPHTIVLTKTRSVPGEARDAITGELIPRIFVSPGTGKAEDFPGWGTYNDFEYQGGRFDHPLGFAHYNILRIRAEGYLTAAFPILSDGAALIARLQPALAVTGIVRDVQGKPVRGAEIAAAQSKRPIGIANGRIQFDSFELDYAVSDQAGRFRLFLTAPAQHLIAAHSSGGVSSIAIETNSETLGMTLQPWARLEGTTAPGAAVRVMDLSARGFRYNQARQKAGEDGRFAFELLPPGRYHALAGGMKIGTNVVVNPGAVTYVELAAE